MDQDNDESSLTNEDKIEKLRKKNKLAVFEKADGTYLYQEKIDFMQHALETNLDIFYTKVDETRTVNADKSKNVN